MIKPIPKGERTLYCCLWGGFLLFIVSFLIFSFLTQDFRAFNILLILLFLPIVFLGEYAYPENKVKIGVGAATIGLTILIIPLLNFYVSDTVAKFTSPTVGFFAGSLLIYKGIKERKPPAEAALYIRLLKESTTRDKGLPLTSLKKAEISSLNKLIRREHAEITSELTVVLTKDGAEIAESYAKTLGEEGIEVKR